MSTSSRDPSRADCRMSLSDRNLCVAGYFSDSADRMLRPVGRIVRVADPIIGGADRCFLDSFHLHRPECDLQGPSFGLKTTLRGNREFVLELNWPYCHMWEEIRVLPAKILDTGLDTLELQGLM